MIDGGHGRWNARLVMYGGSWSSLPFRVRVVCFHPPCSLILFSWHSGAAPGRPGSLLGGSVPRLSWEGGGFWCVVGSPLSMGGSLVTGLCSHGLSLHYGGWTLGGPRGPPLLCPLVGLPQLGASVFPCCFLLGSALRLSLGSVFQGPLCSGG